MDVVDDGDLICPKQPKIGTAYISAQVEKKDNKNLTQALNKYVCSNGQYVYERLTDEYQVYKNKNGGYLPTVAFANNTKQVEEYVLYLLSK
jgi:hypothetical protein